MLGDAAPVVVELSAELDHAVQRQLLAWLPWTGVMLHSRRSGHEVFIVLPPLRPTHDLSVHAKKDVTAGDVLLLSFPPAYRDAPPPRVGDTTAGYSHLGIIYGLEARPATPAGLIDAPVIGRVVSSLAELRDLGNFTRSAGSQHCTLDSLPSQSEET